MVSTFSDIFFVFSTHKPIFIHMDPVENQQKKSIFYNMKFGNIKTRNIL